MLIDKIIKIIIMSLHDASCKKNQRELTLKRINLGNQYKSHHQSVSQPNKNAELSTKRLRYCFKHKTQKAKQAKKLSDLLGNEEYHLSMKFHDAEYFRFNKDGHIPDNFHIDQSNPNPQKNYSNLLQQSPSQNSPNKSQKTLSPSKKQMRNSK